MRHVGFRCFGPLEIEVGQRVLPAGGPLQRGLLAMLLLNSNNFVSADRIISALWEKPPETALGQVQTRIWRLRQLLHGTGETSPAPTARPQLITRAGGYGLIVDPEAVDLLVFERRVKHGGVLLAAGRAREAVKELREALALFRGPVFANVNAPGVGIEAEAVEERRLAAIEQRIEIELNLGLHVQVVAELRELVAAHPYRERLRLHLMQALHRSGRRAEAVAAYRDGHRTMVDGAGLEPSRELKELHRAILLSDAATDPAPAAGRPRATVGLHVPRDLPRDSVHLVGRCPETNELLNYLRGPNDSQLPRVVAIAGGPGVGKTALAVRIAHLLVDDVPDGQLFTWVGGKADPNAILHRFLRGLGVPEREVPETLEERSALYRARMADRRAILVIDDAESEAQVRPLLPAAPGGATLVTSRRRLTALDGVRHLDLPALGETDMIRLLVETVGRDRIDAEPGLPARIVDRCEGLPLAVRAVGARLAARPHWSLARFLAAVEDETRRLDAMSFGDLDVRAAIASSYIRLEPRARQLFRVLGSLDRAEFTVREASELIGGCADELTEDLVDVRLVHPVPGSRSDGLRYRIDGLCRLFARERAALEGAGTES
ncbi:BTAD domain-containing putative transcriptional regulator [Polymorphospora sp. NPDC051019]|uniref:AfsR/SARP family transcriptional regulator n=1 Tax=Polymorphospora sp. NPDC051019 TaxID=3155725 RepID=UPI00342DBB0E